MDPNVVIDLLGGTSAAAKFFEVTSGAVSQWRRHGIPPARAQTLKFARPDIYAAATGTAAATCGGEASKEG